MQHARPIGPTTNAAATFSPEMAAGVRAPERSRHFSASAHKQGLALSQPTHVAATVTSSMSAGYHPDVPQLRKPKPDGWSVSQTTPVTTYSPEMGIGWHSDVPRPAFKAHTGWFGFFPPPSDVPPETVIGWHPDRPQLSKPRPVGWSVAQPTHVSATYTSSMSAGWHPDRPQLGKPKPTGWAVAQTTFVAEITPDMVAGWHPDRPQLGKPQPSGWSVSQLTHVSAEFSLEMAQGFTPHQSRAWSAPHAGGLAFGPYVQVFPPAVYASGLFAFGVFAGGSEMVTTAGGVLSMDVPAGGLTTSTDAGGVHAVDVTTGGTVTADPTSGGEYLMALETNFDATDHLFIGCDVPVVIGGGLNADGNSYHILAAPGSVSSAVVDVSTFTLEFAIRLTLDAVSPVITLTSGGGGITVIGAYNASQASNTQAVRCFLTDTLTLTLVPPGTYYWALKRTDADLETVLAFGSMIWQYAATR